MTTYVYSPRSAVTIAGLLAPVGASGQIFASSDLNQTSPLTLTDANGVQIPNIIVSPLGMLGGFRVEDQPTVVWKSGPYTAMLEADGARIPQGGTAGDVLVKTTGADFAVGWAAAPASGGGGIAEVPAEYVTETELAQFMATKLKFTGLVRITLASDGSYIWSTTATANASNADLRDRSTHTGTQPISSIEGLEAALANSTLPGGIMVFRYYNFTTGAYPERGSVPAGAMVVWFGPVEPQNGNGFALERDYWESVDS